MTTLNKSVRLVSLQFAFSNKNLFPSWAWRKIDKEWVKRQKCKHDKDAGEMIISPVQNCSLRNFVGQLENAGYKITDALYQLRPDLKDDSGRRKYCVARFIFVREEDLKEISREFKNALEENCSFLQKMCEEAMWQVRVFLNPFFQDSKKILNQHALSINMTAREPLIQPNGQPVAVWQKDDSNSRIGDAPLPLKPNHYLHITNNTIQLR